MTDQKSFVHYFKIFISRITDENFMLTKKIPLLLQVENELCRLSEREKFINFSSCFPKQTCGFMIRFYAMSMLTI